MLAALFGAGLIVYGLAAGLIEAPGYMDAEYYFATGLGLARGDGFTEPFAWNYLADPIGIPAPSHAYWQPLATALSALSILVFGPTFRGAQALAVVVAASLAPLSARLASSLGATRREALLAGGFALAAGFFTPYFVTTDTFALFAALGGLLLWQVDEAARTSGAWRWVGVGMLVGLGHLARADGALLWVAVLVAIGASQGSRRSRLGFSIAGYVAVMLPWWARNLGAFGALYEPGASRALWLLEYDELFAYPASTLTFARWWAAGAAELVGHRLAAAAANLQSVLAVNGYVLLLPATIAGGWLHRRSASVRAGAAFGIALFGAMTLVFPFAGARGGFFHSSAALMPMMWALTSVGLGDLASRLAPRLAWDAGRTRTLLAFVSMALAGGLSTWVLAGKAGLVGEVESFSRTRDTYVRAAGVLRSFGAEPAVVAVVDPPGFHLASGSPAIALPFGPESTLRDVAVRYGVDWVVLEWDHPRQLDRLYREPSTSAWLRLTETFDDPAGRPVRIFRVLDGEGP